jgi:hypothetical protein
MDKKLLKEAIVTGDWGKIDLRKLTLKEFMKTELGELHPAHHARNKKTFHKFPKELIGEQGIIWKHYPMKKYTLFSLAYEGAINLAPKSLITKEILIAKNDQETTLLHYIACFDNIKTIDHESLTNKELMVRNSYDSTPLEVASQQLKRFLNSRISPKPKETIKKIEILKENINLILKKLSLEDLKSKEWDQECLTFIQKEKIKQKLIKELGNKSSDCIEI